MKKKKNGLKYTIFNEDKQLLHQRRKRKARNAKNSKTATNKFISQWSNSVLEEMDIESKIASTYNHSNLVDVPINILNIKRNINQHRHCSNWIIF